MKGPKNNKKKMLWILRKKKFILKKKKIYFYFKKFKNTFQNYKLIKNKKSNKKIKTNLISFYINTYLCYP